MFVDASPFECTMDAGLAMSGVLRRSEARRGEKCAVRITVHPEANLENRYELDVVAVASLGPGKTLCEVRGVPFALDGESARLLQGVTIHFEKRLWSSGFVFLGREEPSAERTAVERRVEAILAEAMAPLLSAHGGSVRLVAVKAGTAYVELSGGCKGCSMAGSTVADGIRKVVMEAVPEVVAVVDVTEHGLRRDARSGQDLEGHAPSST